MNNRHGGHLRISQLLKQYGGFTAVDRIDLEVTPGEFFSLLGPSGCGKTTTLRMIAGFEQPNDGVIYLDDVDLSETAPHQRNVNTVFQSYALFPHLTVGDNVAFGLRFSNVPKAEIPQRVRDALDMVQLAHLIDRKPGRLSGGEQQRVALARALVLNPALLLLDEPLGALDAKLKKGLRIELKQIQERVGITFVYVTHDQEEALALSDRMGVMNCGRIEQVGPPRQVYEEPVSTFVADFLGVANVLKARVTANSFEGGCRIALGPHELAATAGNIDAAGDIQIVVRPERVLVAGPERTGPNRLSGTIVRQVYSGPTTQLFVRLEGGEMLQAMVSNRGQEAGYAQGDPVSLSIPPDALRILRSSPN